MLNHTISLLLQRIENSISQPCHLCDAKSTHPSTLCDGCFQDLPRYAARCEICAIPLAPTKRRICGQCLSQPPAFDRVYSPFLYQAPVSNLIQQLKYQHQLHTLRILGNLMSDYLTKELQMMPDILVPVPLHRKRIRERGFNQASELAKRISNNLNLKVENHLIARKKYTEAQTGLKPGERTTNLAGAFKLKQNPAGKRILIVDDVLTTGATATEMAKCLKRKHAQSVEVVTVARADRH